MMKIKKVIHAILEINPNAKVIVNANDINQITWTDGTTPIPKADIESKMNEMANEPEQSDYVEQRRNAYPPIGDQLDMLWHTIDKDITLQKRYFEFYQAIQSVKVKYPK